MIRFICSSDSINNFPETKKEVVFVGRSNVGKSSLINALYNQKLAYVGKTPGKTRLINFFDIDGRYTAVDVPGYGFAYRSKKETVEFGRFMDEYFSRNGKIRLVIMIVDSRIGLTKDDEDMLEFIEANGLSRLIVANKIDKLSNNELSNNRRKFFSGLEDIVYVSASKKKNLDLIRNAIDEAVKEQVS